MPDPNLTGDPNMPDPNGTGADVDVPPANAFVKESKEAEILVQHVY